MNPGIEFICEDIVYLTVAVDKCLFFKFSGYQDDLEMQLGPRRHVVFTAFIYHFHVLRVKNPSQLGFYRRSDRACFFHVLILGPAQEMRHHFGSRFFRGTFAFQPLQPESEFSGVFHMYRVAATQH